MPSIRKEEFVRLYFWASQTVMCGWVPGLVKMQILIQQVWAGPEMRASQRIPGRAAGAAGLRPTLWSRPQTSSCGWMNKRRAWCEHSCRHGSFPWHQFSCGRPTAQAPQSSLPEKCHPPMRAPVKTYWKQAIQERKNCHRTAGQPTAVHPRESTLVLALRYSFSGRPGPPRPHYVCKLHVTGIPGLGDRKVQPAASLSFVTMARSNSAESGWASVDRFSLST